MFAVYNMGIGFCLVVAKDAADRTLRILGEHGRRASIIGHAVADRERRVRVNDKYVGQGKHFAPA